jgi:hypothetical protein
VATGRNRERWTRTFCRFLAATTTHWYALTSNLFRASHFSSRSSRMRVRFTARGFNSTRPFEAATCFVPLQDVKFPPDCTILRKAPNSSRNIGSGSMAIGAINISAIVAKITFAERENIKGNRRRGCSMPMHVASGMPEVPPSLPGRHSADPIRPPTDRVPYGTNGPAESRYPLPSKLGQFLTGGQVDE